MKLSNKIFIVFFTMFLFSCSVYMASHQPNAKDLSLLSIGTHKSLLIAEFGHPHTKIEHDGKIWDIWSFRQGYSDRNKTSRVFGHAVMDVLTGGLWEVIGTSVETAANGNIVSYEVTYDKFNKVIEVIPLNQKSSDILSQYNKNNNI